jgi:hypothetical protein
MRASSVVVVAVMPCLGCFSTWDLAPTDLPTLRHFEAEGVIRMKDMRGEPFRFDKDTKLTFERDYPEGARGEAHRFSAIDGVDAHTLLGFDEGDRQVTVDLTDVYRVEAKNFSVGKTVGLSVGVTLGVAAVAAAVLAVASASSGGWGSGGLGGFSIGAFYADSVAFDIKESRRVGRALVAGGPTLSRTR